MGAVKASKPNVLPSRGAWSTRGILSFFGSLLAAASGATLASWRILEELASRDEVDGTSAQEQGPELPPIRPESPLSHSSRSRRILWFT
jgi:hypothetical protein